MSRSTRLNYHWLRVSVLVNIDALQFETIVLSSHQKQNSKWWMGIEGKKMMSITEILCIWPL